MTKISVNIENPAAQIVRGLLFRNSWTSNEPENIIPMAETRRTSLRPVAKTTFPVNVRSTSIIMIVYMVNPYMQDGYPRTLVQPPFKGQVLAENTP
jgi:hypothetical protein